MLLQRSCVNIRHLKEYHTMEADANFPLACQFYIDLSISTDDAFTTKHALYLNTMRLFIYLFVFGIVCLVL